MRPTSETIIGDAFARWVQSYRDLPLLINQWANVVRWEMRTRLFLRTTEFLWQEGHTAHATREEAVEETMRMLDVYADVRGELDGDARHQGREDGGRALSGRRATFCIEAMMQDRKALQAGTSHFLGQNFARASNIQFLDQNGAQQHAWTTSWGVSTRLIGGLLMTHSDDDGFVLPPRLAPQHVVIVPIFRSDEEKPRVLEYCRKVAAELRAQRFARRAPCACSSTSATCAAARRCGSGYARACRCASRSGRATWRRTRVFAGRRDRAPKDKQSVRARSSSRRSPRRCSRSRTACSRARSVSRSSTRSASTTATSSMRSSRAERDAEDTPTPIHGGFALTHFSGDVELEQKIKDDLSVTVRCIPLEKSEPGTCPFTGKPSAQRVVWAKAY